MKYGSTYYSADGLSTCEIAGAVAMCAIHDLHVNLFRFGGFPQILVEQVEGGFQVTISVDDVERIESGFILSRPEAFKAAKAFKARKANHDEAIFDRVQIALAKVVG